MDIQIRKTQSNLISAGIGVMVFAMWSFLRSLIYIINGDPGINEAMQEVSKEHIDYPGMRIVLVAGLLIAAAADMLFRFYIGRSAISEGKGNRKSSKYIVLSCILVFLYIFGIMGHIAGMAGKLDDYNLQNMDTILSLAIDLTSLYILILLIYSASRLRKLLKLQQAESGTTG